MLRGAAPAAGRAIRSLRAPITVASLLIAAAGLAIMMASDRIWRTPGPWVFYPFQASATGEGLGISAPTLGVAWLVTFAAFGASWLSRPRPRWAVPLLVVAGLVFIYGLSRMFDAFAPPGAQCCPPWMR